MPRPPPTPSLFPYTTLFRSKTTLIELDRRIRENPAYDVRASLVLACGARSCAYAQAPAFRAENLDAQLDRSEEHTSELQSRGHLVCRLLLEKKKQPARLHSE